MKIHRIQVISYSGRKGEERPEAFILNGLRINVLEIQDQWIEEEFKERVRKRYFNVKGNDRHAHCLYFNEHDDEWYYVSKN